LPFATELIVSMVAVSTRFSVEVRKERCEGDGGEEDSGEEG
jgi:hypothetical protein